MAHVEHYQRSDVRRLANEWERQTYEDGRFRFNPTGEIDRGRTPQNYRMVPGEGVVGRLSERLASPGLKVDKRSHVNVISDWAITCPEELKGEPEQVRRFFAVSWEFLQGRYGAENCLQGYVHMDETSPHMHAVVCPVKDGRVSAKALFTRAELSGFHKELDEVMAQEFGQPGLILNGRTKGNYTTAELKERTRREGAVFTREVKANYREAGLNLREKAIEGRESASEAQERDLSRREAELQDERQEALKTAQEAAERQERERQALNERRRQLEEWEGELDEREEELDRREEGLQSREAAVSRKEAVLTAMGRERYERRVREAGSARTEQRSAEAAQIAPTDTEKRGKRAGKIQREYPSV